MIQKIGFGGSCHWCTEAVFQSLIGVENVEQGWIASNGKYSDYSEGVIVHYNDNQISLEDLIEVHLLTHSSSSNHSMRKKYRSAIYVFDRTQEHEAKEIFSNKSIEMNKQFITLIIPIQDFKLNQEKYLDYYRKNPEASFCKNYIHPKLKKLSKSHAKLLLNQSREVDMSN